MLGIGNERKTAEAAKEKDPMAKKGRKAGRPMRMPGIMTLWVTLWSSLFTPGVGAETTPPQNRSIVSSQLNVGFTADKFADMDPKDAKAALRVWVDMISKKKPSDLENVEMLTYPDLTSLASAGREERLDLLFLTPNEYLQIKAQTPFSPVATSTPLGGMT